MCKQVFTWLLHRSVFVIIINDDTTILSIEGNVNCSKEKLNSMNGTYDGSSNLTK